MKDDTYFSDKIFELCSPCISIVNGEQYFNEIEQLKKMGKCYGFSNNQSIIHFGDFLDGIFLLTKGKASARIFTPQGNEKILFLFKPISFFGEAPYFNDVESTMEIVVHPGTELTHFDRKTATYLKNTNSFFNEQLLKSLLRKGQLLFDQLKDLCYLSPEQRVIKFLLYLCREQASCNKVIVLNITQEELSNFVGLHRVTVARICGSLKKLNILKNTPKTKKQLIVDMSNLINYCKLIDLV